MNIPKYVAVPQLLNPVALQTPVAALQLSTAMSEFWYDHLKPAWHLRDAVVAAHGALDRLQAGPALAEYVADLQALQPSASPGNAPALQAMKAHAASRVQLVRQW